MDVHRMGISRLLHIIYKWAGGAVYVVISESGKLLGNTFCYSGN